VNLGIVQGRGELGNVGCGNGSRVAMDHAGECENLLNEKWCNFGVRGIRERIVNVRIVQMVSGMRGMLGIM